ncbi:DUF2922 domain-containing protein [Bacillus niameyensis]|uniref:DUF2922 domain-containing protein n=1 Tax=Bacillus niameyensis TaxID=1522308 RepID=UPI0007839168|nr:DUF2922 domain-containing protein [Bacillus niameyensis]
MKTLELSFLSEMEKTVRITIDQPVEPIDPAQVKAAMDSIIAANVFLDTDGNALTEARSARIIERNVTPIEIEMA